MKSLLWLLAVFAAAVALVLLGRVDAGYVLFVYPPWRVELSMLLFAIVALAAFVACYALARLLVHALGLPATVRAYRARKRRERTLTALTARRCWLPAPRTRCATSRAAIAGWSGRRRPAKGSARRCW